MYGTIARMQPKPGRLPDLMALSQHYESLDVPGFRSSHLFVPDDNPYPEPTVFLIAIFDDKATYQANADSPEQHERYLAIRELLDKDPDWMDGTFESV